MNKLISNNKGTALLMTILILNSILVVSLSAAKIVVSGVKMSGTQFRSTKAYFAGEAGAERVLYEFRKNGLYSGGFPSGNQNVFPSTSMLNSSSYIINYQNNSGNIKFVSVGSFMEVKRSVELEFDFN